jgi:hypothetical protein
MRVVVDTSALYSDPAFAGASGRLLLAACQSEDIELVVPEVVILEAVNVFRERLEQASRLARKAHREFNTLDVEFAADVPDEAAAVAAYEEKLRRHLDDAGASVPPPPEIDHLELAKRAIAKRKPFDGKGRGYRDTLIWQHAVEAAGGDEVIFVTANVKDFANDDRVTLATELADDLEAAGLARDAVRIVESLRLAVREHVEPSVQALTRLRALIDDAAFQDQVQEAVANSLLYRDVDAPDDPDLHTLDVHDVQVDSVQEVRDLVIDEAYEDGDLIDFNIGGTMLAELDFYPLKYEIASADVPDVHVSDWDWNESVARASKTVEVSFEGFGVYDPEAREVVGIDVWLTY